MLDAGLLPLCATVCADIRRELLIGCGNARVKMINVGKPEWSNLTTLDQMADCNPDVVHDLDILPYPFADEQFDEIHAYECLEHCGRQGDWRFFFAQWTEFARILKPNGVFVGTVPLPTSAWAWGDPSHTRVLPVEVFAFLSQSEYERQVGITAMSDFRSIYKADFTLKWHQEADQRLYFVLQKKSVRT